MPLQEAVLLSRVFDSDQWTLATAKTGRMSEPCESQLSACTVLIPSAMHRFGPKRFSGIGVFGAILLLETPRIRRHKIPINGSPQTRYLGHHESRGALHVIG